MTEQKRAASSLFRYFEKAQGSRPWGETLDAGTGAGSIRWLCSLPTERLVAVTGSDAMADTARKAAQGGLRAKDQILVGNWADPSFTVDGAFDTVLVDYLLGAIDGFAPYFQPYLFPRLRALTRGRLYFTGLEPYVTHRPETPAGEMIWRIGNFRDACLHLTGERPYREYPSQWTADHLAQAGFSIIDARRFPIRYRARFINGQIDMCAPRIRKLADRTLADALTVHGDALRREALALAEKEGGLAHGYNYAIVAEPV